MNKEQGITAWLEAVKNWLKPVRDLANYHHRKCAPLKTGEGWVRAGMNTKKEAPPSG